MSETTAPECGCRDHGLTYLRWFSDCEERRKKKQRQVLCLVCLKWRWPDEVGPAARTLTEKGHKAWLRRELARRGESEDSCEEAGQ